MIQQPGWANELLSLLSLALRLEGEGQYNLAKLARASADALSRRAAYEALNSGAANPTRQALAGEIEALSRALSGRGMGEELQEAFLRGAAALAEGRLPLINETPHAYVCRTCGSLNLGVVSGRCPTCGAWPDTFQWFPPVYWLEALDPPAALETLRRTPLEVAALIEGASEEALTRPAEDGGWAVRHILAHLRDAQGVLDYRLELFEQEENPLLESKAVFEWARRSEERPPSAGEIFAVYQARRAQIIARLEQLPLAGWWRSGYHQEFGRVSIKQQVSYFASHERTHLPQIAILLQDQSG